MASVTKLHQPPVLVLEFRVTLDDANWLHKALYDGALNRDYQPAGRGALDRLASDLGEILNEEVVG